MTTATRMVLRAGAALLFMLTLTPSSAMGDGFSIPYGGHFTSEDGKRLVWVQALLQGLEEGGDKLAALPLMRATELSRLNLQALAARLEIPRISLRLQAPSQARGMEDHLSSEPEAVATLHLGEPDPGALVRELGQAETLARYAEVITELRRILPETLELAEKAHKLRIVAARMTISAAPQTLRSPETADAPVALRLRGLMNQMEAYERYLVLLGHYNGRWADSPAISTEMEAILALAPPFSRSARVRSRAAYSPSPPRRGSQRTGANPLPGYRHECARLETISGGIRDSRLERGRPRRG